MRSRILTALAALAVALGAAAAAAADTMPQRPDQIAFNARAVPGSVLVVPAGPTGARTASLLCGAIPSLKQTWQLLRTGQDPHGAGDCHALSTGSIVKLLRQTGDYVIDDPSLPAAPYENDAYRIVRVQVLSALNAAGAPARSLVNVTGYMLIDDLEWPPHR